MACWSVQLFLQGSLVRPTDQQTDRQTNRPTDHATPSVTIGRIYIRSKAMWPKNNNNSPSQLPVRSLFSQIYLWLAQTFDLGLTQCSPNAVRLLWLYVCRIYSLDFYSNKQYVLVNLLYSLHTSSGSYLGNNMGGGNAGTLTVTHLQRNVGADTEKFICDMGEQMQGQHRTFDRSCIWQVPKWPQWQILFGCSRCNHTLA